MHPGENVFFYRRDAGGVMHPGGDVMYMRPRVEKKVIVRSGEATAAPAPPQPPEPKQ